MERDEFKQAAIEAINDLGLSNVTFSDAARPLNSDLWSVQFREGRDKYFRVVIDPKVILSRFERITVETLKGEIIKGLQERDPNDYLT